MSSPLFIDARSVAAALPWGRLIDTLWSAFRNADEATVPQRLHYVLGSKSEPPPVLLVMPAWSPGLGVGTKLVSVYPNNTRLGLPSVHGLYVLMDPRNGRPLAVLDGGELTARRTAAASALASRYLSRPDSRCLLMVGTGRLARYLPVAHAQVRPIERVLVWGRTPDKAQEAARALAAQGLRAEAVASLAEAVPQVDIVSCATLSTEPLVLGDWLRAGTHVDLVGAFTPAMRETDSRVFARADAVWCDTREGVLAEAGDVVQAIASGTFEAAAIKGDLAQLCRGPGSARSKDTDVTVFKSVGIALEDLAAARLAVDAHTTDSGTP